MQINQEIFSQRTREESRWNKRKKCGYDQMYVMWEKEQEKKRNELRQILSHNK